MSESDIDMVGSDGQLPSAQGDKLAPLDRDRRAPRFSWTPAYETTFFQSLCDSVQLGLRENSSFKAEAWERAAKALQEKHGACPTKNHLINKSDNARKRFRLWRGLREGPDFLYNPVAKTVTATEDAWRAHIEREPLSRALRGRPFDHEDYMEVLYPDVVGSGGAPKRVMKPRRRTDGQVGDDSDMPGTSILNLQGDSQTPLSQTPLSQSVANSPVQQRPPLSQTPSGSSSESNPQQRPIATMIPPRAPTGGPSALTPPDEVVPQNHNGKRSLGGASLQTTPFDPSLAATSETTDNLRLQPPPSSPGKRRRVSSHVTASAPGGSFSGLSQSASVSSLVQDTPLPTLDAGATHSWPVAGETVDAARGQAAPRWRETALDSFFSEFAGEDLDLQVKIAENVLSNDHKAMVFCKMPQRVRQHWVRRLREAHQKMSYADAASKGPKQSPEEAAAPQPPHIVTDESASTSSLVDVDTAKVSTVPSDFDEQSIQTDTQAERIDREAAAARAKAEAEHARRRAKDKAARADNWLTSQFARLSDGSAGALAAANLAGVIGLSSYLGYKAWALYDKGRLSWENVGLGVGILAGVGAVEAVFGGYLYKGKKNSSS